MLYLFYSTWKYAKKDRWKLAVCYVLHIISFTGELIQPLSFGMAINAIQKNGANDIMSVLKWLGVYLVGFFIFQIFHHSARYFEITTALKNQQRFVNDMYKKIYNLPMKWHIDHHSGEIVNRIKVAGEALRDFGFSQHSYLENLFLSVGPIVLLMRLNWQIALISVVLTTINLVVVFKINRTIHPILDRQNDCFHAFSARITDFVCNIKTIITLGLGKQTGKDLDKKFNSYYDECMNEFWINQPRCFFIGFGAIATELIVVVYYIWSCRRLNIYLMAGNVVMIVTYFRQLEDALSGITSNFYEVLHRKAAVESVDMIIHSSLHNEVLEYKDGIIPWQDLSIKNLKFKFDNENYILDGIDIDFTKHSKTALVGLSGSGKSTLLNVLGGIYQPEYVEVLADEKNYSSLEAFAKSTVLVSQDPEIFENTINYNITFGLEADDAEIESAIDIAQMNEVLAKLPNGLNTDIREKGVNLSGGEKQRLALTRGLFFSKGKDILLLDEVTSSVDAINERLIMEKILQHYKECCVICTVHRLHILDMFDNVIVMDNGHIVQKGPFSKLIKEEGPFKTLWEKYQLETDSRY